MVIVGIALLALLVVHAAGKSATVTATIAAGGDPNTLPPVSTVAATGNAQSPSPATWGGAPGAASGYAIKLNTNSQFVGVAADGLALAGIPGQPGVPVPFVKPQQFNGFDSVPAATKQLSVNRMPARTINKGNFNNGMVTGGVKL